MKTLKKTFQTAVTERKSMQHLNHRIITLPLHTVLPGSLQQLHYLIDHLIDYYESSCLHYSKQAKCTDNGAVLWVEQLLGTKDEITHREASQLAEVRVHYMG